MKITNNYCQKHKERLRKKAREKYQNLSEVERDIRQKKVRERYQSFTEEENEQNFSIIVNVIRIFLRNKKRS